MILLDLIYFVDLTSSDIDTHSTSIMNATGGVAREVTRYIIECEENENRYELKSTAEYVGKLERLLTNQVGVKIDEKLRASFTITMVGLHLHYPVRISMIPAEWRNWGIVVSDDDGFAKFVCPAQRRAVDQIYFNPSKQALEQAIAFLVNNINIFT